MKDITKKNRKHLKNHETLLFVINILIAFLIFYISAFCSQTGRPTDKIFTEKMLIYEGNLHKKKLERYLN